MTGLYQEINSLKAKRQEALKQLNYLKVQLDSLKDTEGEVLTAVTLQPSTETQMVQVNLQEIVKVLAHLKKKLENCYKGFVMRVFDIQQEPVRDGLLPIEKQINEIIRRFQEVLDSLDYNDFQEQYSISHDFSFNLDTQNQ